MPIIVETIFLISALHLFSILIPALIDIAF